MIIRRGSQLFIKISIYLLFTIQLLFCQVRPNEFQITDLTIILNNSYNAYSMTYEDSLIIHGSGESIYKAVDRDKQKSESFQLDNDIIKKIVKRLYETHFFDLKDNYTEKPNIEFRNNEEVVEMFSIRNHEFITTMKVKIMDYSKTVKYDTYGTPPIELKETIDFIEDLIIDYVPWSRHKYLE